MLLSCFKCSWEITYQMTTTQKSMFAKWDVLIQTCLLGLRVYRLKFENLEVNIYLFEVTIALHGVYDLIIS